MRERFSSFRNRVASRLEEHDEPPDGPEGPQRPVLVVGLGNPGAGYGNTRHNVGAWCVNLLARRHGKQLERLGGVDRATVDVQGRLLHLARPRAFVNESGPPVAAELRRLKLAGSQLLVVYDDLDLPVGQLRIRSQGGHGGHNGMRSLLGALGGGDFARIRIGIDRPYDDGQPVRDPERVAGWVLSVPSRAERARLDEALEVAADAIELAAMESIEVAMNRFNPAKE